MTEETENEEVTIQLSKSVLKKIDRISSEMGLTRQKIIQDVLWDRFSKQDSWLTDLLH